MSLSAFPQREQRGSCPCRPTPEPAVRQSILGLVPHRSGAGVMPAEGLRQQPAAKQRAAFYGLRTGAESAHRQSRRRTVGRGFVPNRRGARKNRPSPAECSSLPFRNIRPTRNRACSVLSQGVPAAAGPWVLPPRESWPRCSSSSRGHSRWGYQTKHGVVSRDPSEPSPILSRVREHG